VWLELLDLSQGSQRAYDFVNEKIISLNSDEFMKELTSKPQNKVSSFGKKISFRLQYGVGIIVLEKI